MSATFASPADVMRRAIELARRGEGSVEPNPMVGAVLVDDRGACLGEGFHERFGGPHAEVHALTRAGEQARGATLYVTLEPCCHHGKTPPCVDALLAAGLRRVVVGMQDPFPLVAGGGIARLRQAGVDVDVGLLEPEVRRLTAPFRKRIETGLPWVHAKWAMTLDGKIASRTGHSRWISSAASRAVVHRLRGRMDAILIGIGTALAASGGALISVIVAIQPEMGQIWTFKSFLVIVLGGAGNYPGALLGGVLLGLVEQLASLFLTAQLSEAVAYVLLVLVLLVRPSGLIGGRQT
jgi:pyrimidine deaminase RibD-like protein